MSLVRDSEREPKYSIAVVEDIRARKQAEDELRMQKALLESQSEASIDGILITSTDGTVVSHNRSSLLK